LLELRIKSWGVANGMKKFPIGKKCPKVEKPWTFNLSRLKKEGKKNSQEIESNKCEGHEVYF
jgi:hypothetical protein